MHGRSRTTGRTNGYWCDLDECERGKYTFNATSGLYGARPQAEEGLAFGEGWLHDCGLGFENGTGALSGTCTNTLHSYNCTAPYGRKCDDADCLSHSDVDECAVFEHGCGAVADGFGMRSNASGTDRMEDTVCINLDLE